MPLWSGPCGVAKRDHEGGGGLTPHDEQRFTKMITDFVEGCGFERPFHLVTIDARGTVIVTRYGASGIGEQVCSGPAKTTTLRAPMTLTCISPEGSGRSVMVAIDAPYRTKN
jgi:hypothetical protein